MSESDSEMSELFWAFLFWFSALAILAIPVLLALTCNRNRDAPESAPQDSGDLGVGEATSDPPSNIRGWLDQKADIAISRRPRVRKHRHHHHASLAHLCNEPRNERTP